MTIQYIPYLHLLDHDIDSQSEPLISTSELLLGIKSHPTLNLDWLATEHQQYTNICFEEKKKEISIRTDILTLIKTKRLF